jgi:ATP-binding cassette, subfamily C (CFTR/MRP), member 1
VLIFAALIVLVNLFFYIRGIIFNNFAIKSADSYNFNLLNVLLKTPMSWYDVTPSGRIISRITKDQDDIDV